MSKATGGFHTPLQQLFLLEERVRRTGATLPEDFEQHKRFQGIKCVINGIDCLIDLRSVAEVLEDKQVTPIPGCVDWIEGVMNYRGALVPVYNIHRFLQESAGANSEWAVIKGPLVVVRHANELCAVRVNRVFGMQKFLLDDFRAIDSASEEETPEAQQKIEFYIDASIGNEEQSWRRFHVTKILDVMTRQDPRLPQPAPEPEADDEQQQETEEVSPASP